MFDQAVRLAVVEMALPLERVTVMASEPEPYRLALAGRDGIALIALEDAAALPAPDCAAVVLDGIDDLEDPPALLRTMAAALPAARIFALVRNAAYADMLRRLIAGAPLVRGHALVLSELAPLFAAGGWRTESIDPVIGGRFPDATLPRDVSISKNVRLRVQDAATLERLQIAGYLVVARPA